MQKSSKTLVLLSVASLLLSGCAALQQDQQGSEQRQEQSQRGAIDTICVVRHQNPQLSSDRLVQAIEAGLKQRGVKTRVVNHDQVPSECRLCLFYGVTAENNVAKTFDFQAVIDGKALQRGSGPVPADGNITDDQGPRALRGIPAEQGENFGQVKKKAGLLKGPPVLNEKTAQNDRKRRCWVNGPTPFIWIKH